MIFLPPAALEDTEQTRLPEGRPSGQGSHADGGSVRKAPEITPDIRTPAELFP